MHLLLAQAFVSEQHPDTLACLSEVLQAPDPASINSFFSRVPSVFDVVIFSVHGYFGQHKVLGMPDTGGQVVYILDQVRALEEELLQRIKGQGLTFTPNILVVGHHIMCCVVLYCTSNTAYQYSHANQCRC
jgi:sucrose synthase